MADAWARFVNQETPHDRRLKWSILVCLGVIGFKAAMILL